MANHYFKYAIRNFKSNKWILFGSISTVFLSTLCISLLFTFVYEELSKDSFHVNDVLSIDNFHKREKDIYLLVNQASPESRPRVIEAKIYFDFNYKDYPDVKNITTIKKYKDGEIRFKYGGSSASSDGIVVDSTFFEIFDFKLKVGDPHTILHDPFAAIITENFAQKLFGNENPIGKVVKIIGRKEMTYTISGIAESPPSNSSIRFDFILPDHAHDYNRMGGDFILVSNNFNKSDFSNKIKDIGNKHFQFKNSKTDVLALKDVYLNGGNLNSNGIFSSFGDKKSNNVLFAIIGIIFLITMLNFSNLQIININSSIKNIGIFKISGADDKHVLHQKATEIFLIVLLSVFIITIAFIVVLPFFNSITAVELSPEIWQIFLLNLTILVLLVASAMVYPAILCSRISIIDSLKNQIFSKSKLSWRKVVVISQFALSLGLLVSSIVIVRQLNLMLKKDLGFTSENIIRTQLSHEPPSGDSKENNLKAFEKMQNDFQYLKNELTLSSSIESFSQGLSPIEPTEMPRKLKSADKDFKTENTLTVSPDYLQLLNLKLVDGRFFERGKDEVQGTKVVINEAAKKYWGISDISKTRLLNKTWPRENGYEIIGVVKDFNYEHLSVKPQPLVILYFEKVRDPYLIKFKNGATQTGIQFVQQLFNKLNPGETFKYNFLSDDIDALYKKEKRLSKIYILFTLIAYAISAIGLFAIALYDTRKRTKEIGVRKVNGAKVFEVMALLNKDFLKWVVIAFVLACPVSWYAMHHWLENFAYKTTLSWWIFAVAGLLALGIVLLTVSWQSWKAATRNPVEALRYE